MRYSPILEKILFGNFQYIKDFENICSDSKCSNSNHVQSTLDTNILNCCLIHFMERDVKFHPKTITLPAKLNGLKMSLKNFSNYIDLRSQNTKNPISLCLTEISTDFITKLWLE